MCSYLIATSLRAFGSEFVLILLGEALACVCGTCVCRSCKNMNRHQSLAQISIFLYFDISNYSVVYIMMYLSRLN